MILGCFGILLIFSGIVLILDTLIYAPVIYIVWNWILPMGITGLTVLTFAQVWWIGLAVAIVITLIWPKSSRSN